MSGAAGRVVDWSRAAVRLLLRCVSVRVSAAVLLGAVFASACGGTSAGEELWGPPSDAEIAEAEELQNAYRSGSRVFPPIDPDAPCPQGELEADSSVWVYRVRRGCLWSQRAHDVWLRDDGVGDNRLDVERYLDSDPFVVAVYDAGAAAAAVVVPTWFAVLVETDEYRCSREVSIYHPSGNVDEWAWLEALYRVPDAVKAPYFAKFPWHEDVAECPRWVARAPGLDQWGPPTRAEVASARELQAKYLRRPPDQWPPLPEASSECPWPEESYGSAQLTVFRYRDGCLIAEDTPSGRAFRPGIDGVWDLYDYESDPWAIWACTLYSSNPEEVGCWSDLPHNARIAELSADG